MSTLFRGLATARRFCTEAAETIVKRKPCRRKTIQEIGSYLPGKGVGIKVTRLLWLRNGYENSYWTISKVMEKNKGRLRYYGRLTWKGVEDPREKPVRTGQKKGWRYLLEGDQKNIFDNARKPAEVGEQSANEASSS